MSCTAIDVISDTVVCTDPWRMVDNCILFKPFKSDKPIYSRGGDHYVGGVYVGGPSYDNDLPQYNYHSKNIKNIRLPPPKKTFGDQ